MIEIVSDHSFALPPAQLWPQLRNHHFLIEIIPDIHEVKEVTDDSAHCVIRPGFAFIRGTLNVELQVLEATEPNVIRFQLNSKGIGTSSESEATLTLAEKDQGTAAELKLVVQKLGGLLKMVPKGLIRGSADKVVADAWSRLEAKLSNPEESS